MPAYGSEAISSTPPRNIARTDLLRPRRLLFRLMQFELGIAEMIKVHHAKTRSPT
jgi:hypothetical protein